HGVEVELQPFDLDAETGKILLRHLVEFGCVQQRLGRDTADIETGAAKTIALFDDRRLEAQLGAARGAVVAAGAGADDDDVVALAHGRNLSGPIEKWREPIHGSAEVNREEDGDRDSSVKGQFAALVAPQNGGEASEN